jgi:perosamine synthetase
MIAVNEPLLNGNERKYLNQCIDTGWISSEGPFVKEFERRFAQRVGRKHGIAVCNGSAALDAAVVALGIGPGDHVFMPTFTIISCGAAIVRAGATPIAVDSDPITWNMDINQLEDRIKIETKRNNRNLKAIMVVHIYGLPADMEPILAIASKYGMRIIEDAAEMHGQTYKGIPCGSFGDISTFSFYPNKHVTTGEGGMIVTNDDALAEKCRALRNLCFDAERRYIHHDLGWNMRLTNLQAGIGLAQLERLDEFVSLKRSMGQFYTSKLSSISCLQLPVHKTEYAENIYWVYGIVLKDEVLFNASEAMKRLQKLGVGTRHFFYPMHLQPVFTMRGIFNNEHHPISERLAERGFYIPSGLALTNTQMEEVAFAIKEVMR